MNTEESTLKNISPEQQQILSILLDIQNKITGIESRLSSLEIGVKEGFAETRIEINGIKEILEGLDKRVLATEIQISNLQSVAYEAVSVSNKTLSIVHGLRGEMQALRAESAFRNQEFGRLEKLVS